MLAGLLAAAAMAVSGCAADDAEGTESLASAVSPHVVYLEQGWDSETRAAFYQTTQGSRLLPFSWFLHLELPGHKEKFRSEKNMTSLGFLVDPATPANPYGLPVGLAQDVDLSRGDAIGLTCAGCHTGEIEFHGRKIRIDGGQAFVDLERFGEGILASLEATLADDAKFERFGDNVLGTSAGAAARAALRSEVEAKRTWWAGRVERSRGLSPHGPTRTDAFAIIGNEVVCALFQNPANCVPGIAPTQFPYLWDTWDFEWVQYNSSVHSPLGRNVGEVTGVFAETEFDAAGLSSSANLENLHQLEEWLKSLRSPAWPEDLLGEIDQELAAQGAAIYASSCASCHNPSPARTAPNMFGLTMARVDFSTPLSLLGTDPGAAMGFATRRAFPGPFTQIASANGLIGPDGKVPVASLLNIQGGMVIQRFFAVNGLTSLQKLVFLGFRETRSATTAQLVTYKARPLNGVAFTAPYLHNGSVPSMYELLLPPAERVKQFYVGNKTFDPVYLGYRSDKQKDSVLLDTTQVGNGNGGHNYGTSLSHAQRMAVIEYLKTL